jgi:hypothetical protein
VRLGGEPLFSHRPERFSALRGSTYSRWTSAVSLYRYDCASGFRSNNLVCSRPASSTHWIRHRVTLPLSGESNVCILPSSPLTFRVHRSSMPARWCLVVDTSVSVPHETVREICRARRRN